jgi:putative oxidoreductase
MNRNLRDDLALLLLRLVGLALAFEHGWGKLTALATGEGGRFIQGTGALGFPMPGFFAWAAALAEFAGGLAVGLGIGTRVGAVFAAFTMGVAAFLRHHAAEQILVSLGLLAVPEETLKGWGNYELALAYFLPFAALALTGPGRFALERVVARRKRG